jgi:hypothetical protein
MATTSPLRQRMIEDMIIRNLSQRRNNLTSSCSENSADILEDRRDRPGIEDVHNASRGVAGPPAQAGCRSRPA